MITASPAQSPTFWMSDLWMRKIRGIRISGDAKTRQREQAIIETLVDSNDLSMMSGQSTPDSGSYHDSTIVPVTPKNSSQYRIVLARETVAIATTHKQHAPTTPRRCRHTHGHVTIKTHTSQQTGFATLTVCVLYCHLKTYCGPISEIMQSPE